MVYAKSLLAFSFVFVVAFVATAQRGMADPNPCTVTPDGVGGFIVSCVSNPPLFINPIVDQSLNGANGTNGNNGANGGTGSFTFPINPGSQAIYATATPAGIFVQAIGGKGDNGGGGFVNGDDGANGGAGGNPTVTVNGYLPITTNAFGVPGIWVQSAGGIGGNGGGGGLGGGGNGGSGGAGGTVTLNAYDAITTVGDNSYGILAQSLGGGGGTGGGGGVFGGGGSGGQSLPGGTVNVTLGLAGGGSPGVIVTYGNRSTGILAQSIGGFGGAGAGGSILGLVTDNGNGGNAGAGGTVNVTTTSDSFITTFGNEAYGIDAESIGGGGGSGGSSFGLFFSSGGSGSAGGAGGSVDVNNGATIVTYGAASKGIFAQSLGGGGGDGGAGIGIVGLGGSGSSTSPGGDVTITNTGNITTNSTVALGGGSTPTFGAGAIFAQSIGGGGGNGGTGAGLFSVGGSGGGGGNSGTVSVNNNATLITNASDSNGIFAQSIGGGGGNGGGSVAASAFVSLAIGGSAGVGGNGGDASVTSNGAITTAGDRSSGIFAQSIGGGGGNGGFAIDAAGGQVGFAIGIGGTAGGGGTGGNVTVNSGSAITTSGNDANGILAQSIGGGGGNGGFSVAASGGIGAASFAMGGTGGNGGSSGDVAVSNSVGGNISTTGNDSAGIVAQSVGGGGGNGGFSVSAAVGAGSAGLSVGGTGAGGGDSGNVTLTNGATVSTSGFNSDALFAQSAGGGGGSGGFSVGASLSLDAGAGMSLGGSGAGGGNALGTVSVSNSGALTTLGDNSGGLFAQSVGGGGGNGGFSVAGALSLGPAASVGIGGSGGGGGNGGTVKVTNTGAITTFGSQSNGLSAQSIGGGGGNGGWSVAGSFGAESGAISIGVGGSGGNGGNGGLVSVTNGPNEIITYGGFSNGLDAQSIGGGGGSGGFDVAGNITGGASLSLGFGGSGGSGGTGGDVDVTNSSLIRTGAGGVGNFANGILAESIGGGGGSGGFNVTGSLSQGIAGTFSLGGSGGGGGDSGNVSVTNSGAISTTGDFASGINAQSLGGGGGDGGFSVAGVLANASSAALALGGTAGTAGNAGTVTVNNTNNIATQGSTAAGILAQSIGGGGGNGGWSVGAGFSGSGVNLSDSFGGNGGSAGSGNTVTVHSGTDGAPVSIFTNGGGSQGILAQSLGGGGGNGGWTVNVTATGDGDGTPDAAKFGITLFNIGYGLCSACPGSGGGDANNAGNVSVTSYSAITTHGDNSSAIQAQSIGGGGGSGAWTVGAMIDNTGPSTQIQWGSGGGGGNGGKVNVFSSQTLFTNGANSDGILAQSIGGGGGYGGISATNGLVADVASALKIKQGMYAGDQGGNADDVTVNNTSDIKTMRGNSNGIVAQSVGGGGGQGGFSIQAGLSLESGVANSVLNYALGSNGGAGGSAGNVSVTSTASQIQTLGSNADGILAQSIGGGGGDGGFAINGAITPGWAVGFSLGGGGGTSGAPGTVFVSNGTLISTSGDLSGGIIAQSIGGGGGSGGFAFEGLGTTGFTADSAVGGSSSAGSDGNSVTVSNSGLIGTLGNQADAILAQSIGGGGGNGGAAMAGAVTTGNGGAFFAYGATGSGGGNGGLVQASSDANLATLGNISGGLVAQSLGGGGGNGGFSIAGGYTGGSALELALGGGAGAGGNGGTVFASSGSSSDTTSIATQGNIADGILAQSIGGGGGNSGFAIGGGVNSGSTFNLAIGRTGGSGGLGGAVTATNYSSIATGGAMSNAIAAQSIGGGGGDGGFSIAASLKGNSGISGTLSLGGNGGAGGSAGKVTVDNIAPQLVTSGDQSNGILAQSIGGGGGNGGFSVGAMGSIGSKNLTLAFGGNGGTGGTGGIVSTTNGSSSVASQIATSGAYADGVLAQSIGGGGGNGGWTVAALSSAGASLAFSLGGDGGSGNDAADVSATNYGVIQTTGISANGIAAQSIGAGGGSGGFNETASASVSPDQSFGVTQKSSFNFGNGGGGGNAFTAFVTNNGQISTSGANANGVLAQSIGGGGGFGGFGYGTALLGNWGIGLGSSTAGGGNASAVTVINNGTISTSGNNADDIIAQSIGGGGGDGGFSMSAGLNTVLNNPTGNIGWSLGGNGGNGGTAGSVSVTNRSQLFTTGANAAAILAQSIGGGGGNGGTAMTALASASKYFEGFSLALGGNGGTAGNGGTVTVTNSGTISTTGAFSNGIIAQSIGGGGGNGGNATSVIALAGLDESLAYGGAGTSGGAGGNVTVTNNGAISTTGFGSAPIVAQSIGGGGGTGGSIVSGSPITGSLLGFKLGGQNGGTGASGTVTITNNGTLAASGMFATDLLTQSVGGGGGDAAVGILDATNTTLRGLMSLGASGGTPGNGTAVNSSNLAQLTTSNFGSNAMLAQSIGGGGGVSGIDIGQNATDASVGGLAFGETNVSGAAGNGAAVTASDNAVLATSGDASGALLAQTVSGGGGFGALTIGGTYGAPSLQLLEGTSIADLGTGANVNASTLSNALLQTTGFHSDGLAAQSIAGGGGTGTIEIGGAISGTPIGFTLGATATGANSNGTAGSVTVSNAAQKIITTGDLSTTILAQSIGGGGGDAAFKLGGAISGAAITGTLGGSQLTAGTGGSVSVTNTGVVGDSGNGSLGILAQSIGGGGGIGGFDNVSATIPSFAYVIGGNGDNGTIGGSAQITNSGKLVTNGIGDAGLTAQSIGGGGGVAGFANLSLGAAATTLNMLAGERGGSNNVGSAAGVTNTAQVVTTGADAFGVTSQSIGGGGGNDPLLATGTLTTGSSGNQLNMQIGGTGNGSGNNAGTASLTSNVPLRLDSDDVNGIPDELDQDEAPLIAAGDGAIGVLAQSIGAGGGNGYLMFNGAFSTGMPKNATVQVGSAAGQAGNGNTVTMNTSGGVLTGMHPVNGHATGAFADGILGQSIGGGGGNGLLTLELGLPTTPASVGNVIVSVGGHGVGNGGNVSLSDINGSVETLGSYAAALAAQSIGGGGGNGAANVFGPLKLSPPSKNPAKYTLNVAVGGNGSSGNGGLVNVTQNTGIVQTFGDGAQGILAQSIGGGGGTGGPIHSVNEFPAMFCSVSGNNCSVKLVAATVAIGGNASTGNGSAVTVSNTGSIGTAGEDASAIMAQSIGGGGGLGGDADIVGGPSLMLTGGGHTINVGGTNGSTGDGNTVSVTDAGAIFTQGDNSSGIFAQSIGGGGGVGGLGLGSLWGSGPTVLGGSGLSSGNGGAVNVTVNNTSPGTKAIYTTGSAAFGIFAQSVGGGGGLAGDVSGGVSASSLGKGSKLTSTTSGGGNGGAVTVVDNGNIKTTGNGSDGIFAQSIGGGGGLTTGFAGSAGAAGNAGAVSVTQNGIIETLGNSAHAIFAQSAGGTGTGGNVTVNVTGDALAYGPNSDGILAQSIGGAGNGSISITINPNSVVQGGTGSGSAGVQMLGGKNNTLINHGTITTASSANAVQPRPLSLYETDGGIVAAQTTPYSSHTTSLMTDKMSLLPTLTGTLSYSSGVAVYADSPTLTLDNQGNIYGSMALNGTKLLFTNSGTYLSGSQINLGTGTLSLAKHGVMTPGAGGFVAATNLIGDFIAENGSDYLVNVDLTNNSASLLNVSGRASLGGSIDLDLLSTNAAAPGAHSDTIITAGLGLTNNGVALTPPKSAVATFNLGYLSDALLLNYDIDYAPQSGHTLSRNDLSFGSYIGAIQTAGSSPKLTSFMSDVFGISTIPKLKTFYDRFTPAATAALSSSTLLSNLQFSDEMLRCHVDGIVTESRSCNWALLGAQSSQETASFSSVSYGHSASGFAAGFERRVGSSNTSVGAAIHYTRDALSDSDNAASLSGGGLEAGVSASHVLNNGVELSADLLAGEGNYNSVRQLSYPSAITHATGTQAISYLGAHLRSQRRFGGANKAVTPFVDLGLTRVNVGRLLESGADTFNEDVAPYRVTYPTITGGVRLEDSKRMGATVLHGSLDLSLMQIVGNPQASTSAVLEGSPVGVAPFAVTNTLDRTHFGIGPSLEMTRADKASVRIGATYSFSRYTHSGGAYIEFRTKL